MLSQDDIAVAVLTAEERVAASAAICLSGLRADSPLLLSREAALDALAPILEAKSGSVVAAPPLLAIGAAQRAIVLRLATPAATANAKLMLDAAIEDARRALAATAPPTGAAVSMRCSWIGQDAAEKLEATFLAAAAASSASG
jgi:hypothetical protein